MKWHPEAVSGRVRRALGVLRHRPWMKDFYLAGGTGLALRLGHRVSVDLNFFSSENRLGFADRERIKSVLRDAASFRIREEKDKTLHGVVEEAEIRLLHYNYPLVRPPDSWNGIRVASVEDIALMKLGAAVGRGARKDFIDLYAVTRRIPMSRLFRLAGKKFPDARDFRVQALKALVYFEDAEKDPAPRLLRPMEWTAVKRYFEAEAPRLARSVLE